MGHGETFYTAIGVTIEDRLSVLAPETEEQKASNVYNIPCDNGNQNALSTAIRDNDVGSMHVKAI